MGKLILSLEDDEMSLFKKQYVSLGELQEEIDKLEDEGEKLDKRKKEYKAVAQASLTRANRSMACQTLKPLIKELLQEHPLVADAIKTMSPFVDNN